MANARAAGPLIDYAPRSPAAARWNGSTGIHRAGGPDPTFDAFLTAPRGKALERFCLHQALSDRFGPFWNTWPEALQNPTAPRSPR
jgi:4-alpha-glucanotransferase